MAAAAALADLDAWYTRARIDVRQKYGAKFVVDHFHEGGRLIVCEAHWLAGWSWLMAVALICF